jgi:hypothetical protein
MPVVTGLNRRPIIDMSRSRGTRSCRGSTSLATAGILHGFFFYGSLMDHDVLSLVLGRRVRPAELLPAVLPDVARVACRGVSYPRLVAAPGRAVDGSVMPRPAARDAVRIAWFEHGEYEIVAREAWLPDGGRMTVHLFAADDAVLPASHEPWCLDDWRVGHKAAYLEQCRGWMSGCPEPGDRHDFVAMLGEAGILAGRL